MASLLRKAKCFCLQHINSSPYRQKLKDPVVCTSEHLCLTLFLHVEIFVFFQFCYCYMLEMSSTRPLACFGFAGIFFLYFHLPDISLGCWQEKFWQMSSVRV